MRANQSGNDKVHCQTPTPGKRGVSIDGWKYRTVRQAVLKAVGKGKDGLAFSDLPRSVASLLSEKDRQRLGSISWYVTTVKLDMEVNGEIERVPGAKPQRLRRA
jgi:hypothetical protein